MDMKKIVKTKANWQVNFSLVSDAEGSPTSKVKSISVLYYPNKKQFGRKDMEYLRIFPSYKPMGGSAVGSYKQTTDFVISFRLQGINFVVGCLWNDSIEEIELEHVYNFVCEVLYTDTTEEIELEHIHKIAKRKRFLTWVNDSEED
jgi:hypothetical protein